MKHLVGLVFSIFIISCTNTPKKVDSIYFGGEIVNPKANFVEFFKENKLLDTLYLNKINKFSGTFHHLKEGLYTFKHGYEFQYVYLTPGDSLSIRLNSWSFDESIVYSGKGSAKNEFLLSLFLQNEKDEVEIFKFYPLNSIEFDKKISAMLAKRLNLYDEFLKNEHEISENFKNLAKAAVYYPVYKLKEYYPLYHKIALNLNKLPNNLSANFYGFRKDVNLNDTNLVSFYPYQNYVISYLFNLGYQQTENSTSKLNITQIVLNEITQNIQLNEFKNSLLKRVVVNDFLMSESTCGINIDTYNLFLKYCTNKDYKNTVKNLVNDSQHVLNNEPLPNFKIYNYKNNHFLISDIIKNKNTVIYFWSPTYVSTEYLTSRILFLENKYPKILFIGINMDDNPKSSSSDKFLKEIKFNNQYILPKDSKARVFLTSNYPRTIIVNKNGVVINGFTYLDALNLNAQLNKL